MRFWKKKATPPTPPKMPVEWEEVVKAGNRCNQDIQLIEQITLLDPEQQQALKNEAIDMFFKTFKDYISR